MVIETKRLILRPFLEGDAADVYEYLKEPAVNCFASMKLHSLDEAKEEMKKRLGETEYYFAITLKEGGKVIGEIDAYPEAGEPHADEGAERDTFSPCWMLNENYQGKGYAFEAAHAFFDYLFMPSSTISFPKRAQGEFTPTPKTIIFPASTCARNWGCDERACFWNSSPS